MKDTSGAHPAQRSIMPEDTQSSFRGLPLYRLEDNFDTWEQRFLGHVRTKRLGYLFPFTPGLKKLNTVVKGHYAKAEAAANTDHATIEQKAAFEKLQTEFLTQQAEAYGTLITVLSPEVLDAIRDLLPVGEKEECPEKLFKALRELKRPESVHAQLTAIQELQSAKMRPNDSLASYLTRLSDLHKQLEGTTQQVSDYMKWMWMKQGLPGAYDLIIELLDQTITDEKDIKYATLTQQLRRRALQKIGPQDVPLKDLQTTKGKDTALMLTTAPDSKSTSGKSKNGKISTGVKCTFCQNKGHLEKDCRKKQNAHKKCDHCSKQGHLITECRKLKREQGEQKTKAHAADDKCMDFAFATRDLERPNEWLLDSGATSHFATTGKMLHGLAPTQGRSTGTAGSERLNITHIGKHERYGEVKVVPAMSSNLLSIGQLTDDPTIKLIFQGDACTIYKGDEVQTTIPKGPDRLYRAHHTEEEDYVSESDSDEDLEPPSADAKRLTEWHERLGHLSASGIRALVKEGKIELSDKTLAAKLHCRMCIMANTKHKSYQKPRIPKPRAVTFGALTHTDTCGPFSQADFDGNRYFQVYVDDWSRAISVYTLPNKTAAETIGAMERYFNKLSAMGARAHTLRSDQGGEFLNVTVRDYLQNHGITHEVTGRQAHAQNGVAERAIQTVTNMAKAMLIGSGLPRIWWGHAVQYTAYIRNCCITRGLQGGGIPLE